MANASLQAAFVLHHRPFRDTSMIADLLTPDYGRVSVVARGARSPKSTRRVLLQPFRPLLVSWTGRSSLRTLTGLEDSGMPVSLSGRTLACAYYATELALRLIPEAQFNATAFALYARTLTALGDGSAMESTLRYFETELLDSLGLLPDFSRCDPRHGEIRADTQYWFDPDAGVATPANDATRSSVAISGKALLAMAQRDFGNDAVLREAKLLMRRLLSMHLGGRPLKSRDVFLQYRNAGNNDV